MNQLKSLWTSITGSISSIVPMFFAVCKSGVCTAACVSPIASLLGISSASLIASPLTQSLFPLLLVISSVSFTVSYYKLYVLPKYTKENSCSTDCACDPPVSSFQQKFPYWTFWLGLVASIIFFTYFEYQNYKTNTMSKNNFSNMTGTEACCSVDTATLDLPCCEADKKCESNEN